MTTASISGLNCCGLGILESMWKPALLAAFLLVVGLSQSAAGAAEQSARNPRVTHLSPLVVSGSSFSHAEPLVVRVASAGRTESHSLRTSASGTFTSTFALHIDPCLAGTTISVRRAGRSATLVQLKLHARARRPKSRLQAFVLGPSERDCPGERGRVPHAFDLQERHGVLTAPRDAVEMGDVLPDGLNEGERGRIVSDRRGCGWVTAVSVRLLERGHVVGELLLRIGHAGVDVDPRLDEQGHFRVAVQPESSDPTRRARTSGFPRRHLVLRSVPVLDERVITREVRALQNGLEAPDGSSLPCRPWSRHIPSRRPRRSGLARKLRGHGSRAVRVGHLAVVERLVEDVVRDTFLPRDLAQ